MSFILHIVLPLLNQAQTGYIIICLKGQLKDFLVKIVKSLHNFQNFTVYELQMYLPTVRKQTLFTVINIRK